tara:strand:+ start:168 stop:509 length:342 start_codon:yes stop_codon:yes gene_type:complete
MDKPSLNINFYSGRQWSEITLVKKFPPSNSVWNVGLHSDIGYERYFVLPDDALHEGQDPWERWMLPWRKNETDTTTYAWTDTEAVYDLPENLVYQFRWTTVAGKRIKLWRKKP